MLTALALGVVRARRAVLVLAVLFLALAGAVGGGVAKELSSGGFDDPDAPSTRAVQLLEEEFGGGPANFALLVTAPGGVDSPSATRFGEELTGRLAGEPGLVEVRSWWTAGRPDGLRSEDGTKAVVLARITGDEDTQIDRAGELAAAYAGAFGPLEVRAGGEMEVFRQVGDTIERDLKRAESIAFPVTAVLLVLVFGSAVAAGLPLLIGVLSILGTFLVLHLLAQATDVSVYSVNLAISLGLGLGIDYSLFMLTRYREELRRGRGEHNAVVVTVRTAGRTVAFSALTVLLSLAVMLVFPLYFLKSFAYAGISAVVFALLGALVVLPAALACLGRGVDRFDLNRPLRRLLRLPEPRPKEVGEGFWHRVAVAVMRRPIGIGTAVAVLLLVLGTPFTQVAFSLPDDRVLPRDAAGHVFAQTIRDEFPGNESLALTVVAQDVDPGPAGRAGIEQYAASLSVVDGVDRVDSAAGSWMDGRRVSERPLAGARTDDAAYLVVVPEGEGYGPEGEAFAKRVRAVDAPFDVVVGGPAAALADTKASLADRMPLALGLIALATLVLLFLFTGSVVLPVKAVVLNLLSLSATFGAMVWVFQEGHLTWLVGDPITTGTLDTTTPILMFCVLFGLSMDYEVFLLSRIKEEWDAHGDNARAVAVGLEKTGRLISAAAALLAIVFIAFVSSDIAFIKLLGLGTALAVVVDATLVRGALVPSFMRLAGRWNWWAPQPLRRLHDRFGLHEAVEEPEHGAVDVPAQRRQEQRVVAGG